METILVRPVHRALLLCACVLTFAFAALAVTAAAARADDPAGNGAGSMEVVVKQGDRGTAVKSIQHELGLDADGVFGRGTTKAVKAFQKRHDIDPDGVVGPETRKAMGLKAFASSAVKRKGAKKKKSSSAPSGDVADTLDKIAQCESGGDPTAVSRNGKYFGKYQFSKSTWTANGGKGDDPSVATEAEQDRIATKLYKAEGTDPWPVCGADV